MNTVLLVAYHFPPQAGSSGLLRALGFCRYLPESGWRPVVLTAQARAYERLDAERAARVPADVPVVRAFALDTQRHLALGGRYPRWLALPDRWATWCLGAVPAGLRAVRERDVDVLLTTFPIATAVLIGLILHRRTGKPWVIDFRDSMTEDDYPRDPRTRRVYRWIERQAVARGARLIFTAESARRMYLQRYPALGADRCLVIPNGYDEADFEGLPAPAPTEVVDGRPVRLLHSGLIYPEERDPRPLFGALARLKRDGRVAAADLRIDLRAAGSERYYQDLIDDLAIGDVVRLLPALPHRQALEDQATADALLLLQAASCNHQIPAKVYEYLRWGKPVLALTPEAGDTAALLRQVGGATIVDLADEDAVLGALPGFLRAVRDRTHPRPSREQTQSFTRRQQTRDLARCLRELVADTTPRRGRHVRH